MAVLDRHSDRRGQNVDMVERLLDAWCEDFSWRKGKLQRVETGKLETKLGNVKKGHCAGVHTIGSEKIRVDSHTDESVCSQAGCSKYRQ